MLARFLSTVGLAEILESSDGASFPSPLKNVLLDCFERPTLGKWIAILRAVRAVFPRPPKMLFPELDELAQKVLDAAGGDKDTAELRILPLRNMLAHGRITTEYASALLDSGHREQFEMLWTGAIAQFLSDVQLVGLTDTGLPVLLRGSGGAAFAPVLRPIGPAISMGEVIATRTSVPRVLELYPLQVFGRVLRRDSVEPVTKEAVSHVYARMEDVPEYIALHARQSHSDGTCAMREAMARIFPLSAWRREHQRAEEARIADTELRAAVAPFRFRDVVERVLVEQFVGRKDHLATVLSWLEVHPSGTGIVFGEPGMGKTAFAAHLSIEIRKHRKEWLCFHHFFKVEDDRCNC